MGPGRVCGLTSLVLAVKLLQVFVYLMVLNPNHALLDFSVLLPLVPWAVPRVSA